MRGLQALKENESEEKCDSKKLSGKKKEGKWITPTVENFRRSKLGYKLMVQQVTRLLKEQALLMPNAAMLDVNHTTVSWKFQGKSGTISLQELQTKTAPFFCSYFVSVRKRVVFGAKIQGWLADIEAALKQYSSKKMHELVAMIALSKLIDSKGYMEQDDEEGEGEGED